MFKKNIILVGCGNMGLALLKGWIANNVPPECIIVISPHNHSQLKETYSVDAYPEINSSIIDAEKDYIIVFAVKPQIASQVMPLYKFLTENNKNLFISIITGKTSNFFKTHLSSDINLIRAMPNLAALVSESATALYASDNLPTSLKKDGEKLFNNVGKTWWLDNEAQIDLVTAISGSGLAYFFAMVQALYASAQDVGLESKLANDLAFHTIYGSAKLLTNNENVEQLIKQVSSPKGTTEAALKILMPELGTLITKSVKAAISKSLNLAEIRD